MRKPLLLLLAILLAAGSLADDRKEAEVEYWVDSGARMTLTTTDQQAQFTVDGSTLAEGLHALYLRAKDSEGHYSPVQRWMFYRTPAPLAVGGTTLEYWIDNQAHQTAETVDGIASFKLDASSLSEGLHTLSYRATTDGLQPSAVKTWLFFHKPSAGGSELVLEYWFDDGPVSSMAADEQSFDYDTELNELTFALLTDELEDGLHTLNYRLKNVSNGVCSPAKSWLFYRTTPKPVGIDGETTAQAVTIGCTEGAVMVVGAEGGSCRVFDLHGRELAQAKSLDYTALVRVPQAGAYVVSVTTAAGLAVVKKIAVR